MTFQVEITKLIDSQVKKKKKAKIPYKKPESLKQLEIDDFNERYKNSSLPVYARSYNFYRDDSANSLTKSIVRYVELKGGFANRITTTGTYRADLKRFIPSTQRKGTPDIDIVYNGKAIKVEVKHGKDVMSQEQKQVQSELLKAGACYIVARTFDQFIEEFNNLKL